MTVNPDPKSLASSVKFTGLWRAVTFIRSLEPQGAATAVGLEEEPHLVVGADDEIWDRGACQAVRRERFREARPTKAPGKNDGPTDHILRGSGSQARPEAHLPLKLGHMHRRAHFPALRSGSSWWQRRTQWPPRAKAQHSRIPGRPATVLSLDCTTPQGLPQLRKQGPYVYLTSIPGNLQSHELGSCEHASLVSVRGRPAMGCER